MIQYPLHALLLRVKKISKSYKYVQENFICCTVQHFLICYTPLFEILLDEICVTLVIDTILIDEQNRSGVEFHVTLQGAILFLSWITPFWSRLFIYFVFFYYQSYVFALTKFFKFWLACITDLGRRLQYIFY